MNIAKIVILLILFVAIGVGGYFTYKKIKSISDKNNSDNELEEARRKIAKDSNVGKIILGTTWSPNEKAYNNEFIERYKTKIKFDLDNATQIKLDNKLAGCFKDRAQSEDDFNIEDECVRGCKKTNTNKWVTKCRQACNDESANILEKSENEAVKECGSDCEEDGCKGISCNPFGQSPSSSWGKKIREAKAKGRKKYNRLYKKCFNTDCPNGMVPDKMWKFLEDTSADLSTLVGQCGIQCLINTNTKCDTEIISGETVTDAMCAIKEGCKSTLIILKNTSELEDNAKLLKETEKIKGIASKSYSKIASQEWNFKGDLTFTIRNYTPGNDIYGSWYSTNGTKDTLGFLYLKTGVMDGESRWFKFEVKSEDNDLIELIDRENMIYDKFKRISRNEIIYIFRKK